MSIEKRMKAPEVAPPNSVLDGPPSFLHMPACKLCD